MSGGKRRGGRREGTSTLIALGEILRRKAGNLGIEPAVHLVEIRQAWESIVGPALARESRVASFQGGVVVIAAAHPLVAQEIRMRRGEILSAVGSRVGGAPTRLQVVIRPRGKMAEMPTETGV